MKKIILFATAALLISGISFAEKGKKKKCAKGKSCCTKMSAEKKACCKDKNKTAKI